MLIREAAARLGTTERVLRHYEKQGLLETRRSENGYRVFTEADVRRAERIRDLIGSGFSTREVKAMEACLSDEASGPCEEGIPLLKQKLEHIDRLRDDLDKRRQSVMDRLAVLQTDLADQEG